MNYPMTEEPQVVVSLAPTNLDNLMSPQYQKKSAVLLEACRAAPELVGEFIAAANAVEQAWSGGDLAGAVRLLCSVRDRAEAYRGN